MNPPMGLGPQGEEGTFRQNWVPTRVLPLLPCALCPSPPPGLRPSSIYGDRHPVLGSVRMEDGGASLPQLAWPRPRAGVERDPPVLSCSDPLGSCVCAKARHIGGAGAACNTPRVSIIIAITVTRAQWEQRPRGCGIPRSCRVRGS